MCFLYLIASVRNGTDKMDTSRNLAFMKSMIGFIKDEQGATTIEYGLILMCILVVVSGAVTVLGTYVNTLFTLVTTKWP